jgi:hypothetical protein
MNDEIDTATVHTVDTASSNSVAQAASFHRKKGTNHTTTTTTTTAAAAAVAEGDIHAHTTSDSNGSSMHNMDELYVGGIDGLLKWSSQLDIDDL